MSRGVGTIVGDKQPLMLMQMPQPNEKCLSPPIESWTRLNRIKSWRKISHHIILLQSVPRKLVGRQQGRRVRQLAVGKKMQVYCVEK